MALGQFGSDEDYGWFWGVVVAFLLVCGLIIMGGAVREAREQLNGNVKENHGSWDSSCYEGAQGHVSYTGGKSYGWRSMG